MVTKQVSLNSNSLRKAIILLIILAILDSLFTDFGIRHNFIHEANPLMWFVYDTSIFGFYVLKITLPLSLLFLLSKVESKPYLRFLIKFTILLYGLVLFIHLFWISLIVV